jgi:nucleotide-binding universal stress UspA family protein
MPRVLACTDGSIYADSVYGHAAWAAERLGGASVQVLHVLDRAAAAAPADRSGAIGFDASEELLRELAELDAERGRVALRRGRALLAQAERRLRAAGVAEVVLAQRHGSVVETVTEFEAGADLVVIGKRGEAADFAVGHLGANLERVARASARPVLVASRAFRPIGRVLIAYDGGPAALKAIDYAARQPVLKGLACHVVTVAPQGGSGALDQPAGMLRRGGLEVTAEVLHGEPEQAIAAYVAAAGIDLLVMGAYGHSRVRVLLIGSTTTALLRACRIPVLVFR